MDNSVRSVWATDSLASYFTCNHIVQVSLLKAISFWDADCDISTNILIKIGNIFWM